MKIEQSLLDRFIEVRTPELTAEQVTQFFDGITLNDVTVSWVNYDGANNRLFRGTIMSPSRKWRATRVSWTNTLIDRLVKPEFVGTQTLEEFLAAPEPGKMFIDPGTNSGNFGHILIPTLAGQTYDEAATLGMLTALTGYDFSDVGTLKNDQGGDSHTIEMFPNPTAEDSVLPNISLVGRAELAVRIIGPVVTGIVVFVNDGFHNFTQDVDIGTVPGALPAST